MRTREQVTEAKLRGGFYSPPRLVDFCLDRIEDLTNGRAALTLLEPAAGDGAFLRGIAGRSLAKKLTSALAVEVIGSEASKCRELLSAACVPGAVITGSVIEWALSASDLFDVAVGNPPFVRYQFLSDKDKDSIPKLGSRLGLSLMGVGNLWIPVFLAALARLKSSGVFAFIVPTECFTGVSAGLVREWLIRNADHLRLDLFPPGSFPAVLQEVMVISGTRRDRPQTDGTFLRVFEHRVGNQSRSWDHLINAGRQNWTRYLLTPEQLSALREARQLPDVVMLGQVAKFEVAVVTGANDYFCVGLNTAEAYGLSDWTLPLLPRTRHAKGLRYQIGDHLNTLSNGAKGMLLKFAADLPDPTNFRGPSDYIALGEQRGLPLRYKCRIRSPWYRVPNGKPGRLLLSKRAHRFHRVIRNEAAVITTDTIYRGDMFPLSQHQDEDVVAAFHNSLTLLSTELEGRSFGGGVLELVPTEISRLVVPMPSGFGDYLDHLDRIARSTASPEETEDLVDETDSLLITAGIGLSANLLHTIREARNILLQRRLARN